MSGMLVPVGVGIAGALFILGALYSIKVMNRRRRNGFKRHKRKVWNQYEQNLVGFRALFTYLTSLMRHTQFNGAKTVHTDVPSASDEPASSLIFTVSFKVDLFLSPVLQLKAFNAFLFSFPSRENSTACKIE